MDRTRRSPDRARRSVVGLAITGVLLVLLAVVAWQLASSSPREQTLNPLPPARGPGQGASAPGAGARPDAATPAEGASRPPAARVEGRRVWFAPAPEVETDLARVDGPLPSAIRVDENYPPLRAGDVRRALMVMAVVDDTAALIRFLVLDQSWQVFELDLVEVGAPRGSAMSRGALSPDGTRVAFGFPGGYLVVDLRGLGTKSVGVADVGTRDLSWSRGSVLLGEPPAVPGDRFDVMVTDLLGGLPTQSARPGAVVVDEPDPALLVLDGDRSIACCAVAGRADRDHVLYESRTGRRLHVLSWDTRDGSVALVSRIEPVVSNDWYMLTSYADLAG